MVEWFRRFGDIPGISFAKDPALDPGQLLGYAAVPAKSAYVDSDGQRHEYLMWSFDGTLGSMSPAQKHAFGDWSDLSSEAVLRKCMEGLELPGDSSNYHFLLQGSAKELWRRHRDDPSVIEVVERLCWLDVALVEAHQDSVRVEGRDGFFSIESFMILITLFEREGALHEALAVAERASRFDQGEMQLNELRTRVAAVESEV